MKRKLALLMATAICLAALAGCGASTTPSTPAPIGSMANGTLSAGATDKLVIWSYMNEGEPVATWQQMVVEKYNEIYPDVTVELVFCGREILTQFQTKLNDKNAPDFPDLVSQMSGTMIPLALENQFLSLDEAFATKAFDQDKNWGDTFIPQLLDSFKVNDTNYLVPEGMYTHGIFYDQTMFDKYNLKAPKTWDDLMTVCETLKQNNIAPFTLDGTTDVYNEWWYVGFCERLVKMETFDAAAQGKVAFASDPGFLKAAEYLATFAAKGYFQQGFEGSVFPAAQAMLTQGKAGMLYCGAWIPTEMASQTPAEMKMKMFALPELPGSVSKNFEEIWSNCFAVTKDAKNSENAINWLKVYSSMGVQAEKADLKNPSPLIGGPVVAELDTIETIVAQSTGNATTYGGLALYGDWFNNILGPLSTKLITGAMSPTDFIAQLDKDTTAHYKN